MFDVFYIGENEQLLEQVPFAKPVTDSTEVKSRTKMYWLIEPNVELVDYGVLNYRPPEYDQQYEHIWKWDSRNYGGLKLIPRNERLGIKEVNRVVCKKRFDILRTPTPEDYFTNNMYATHVWCVDPEYKLNDTVDWAPDNFEPSFIHSFHLRGQLEHKYPEREGGVKLYPRQWKSADIKYHKFLDASISYPVMYVTDVEDYAQRDVFDDDYVWLIDKEHRIDETTVDWVPNPFEDGFIHSFRMPYQLQEKTWSYNHSTSDRRLGGIRLVPKNWKTAFDLIDNGIIIHNDCPIQDESYDVFYIDEDEFTSETYQGIAERSKTEWFWVVDREFEFNGKLSFVPAEHEQEYIHVFKIPGHLSYRYPVDVTEPWDDRCGGVRLVNKNYDLTKQKYQNNVVPVRYDIFFLDNPKDFKAVIGRSRTKMCWVIDAGYQISQAFKYVPTRDEQKYLLNFKISGQLNHKYPEEEGGVYLVPTKYNDNTSIKYKGTLDIKKREYPILYVEDVTDLTQVTEDCWLIDKEYQIDNDINWVPGSFENQSIHTFHVPGQLKHKYPENMGGVRWVPKSWNGEYVIHDDLPVKPKRYPVVLVEDPNDYAQATGECWLIDKEYIIDQDLEWIPSNFEKTYIHSFHVPGQLTHKYPEGMGGIRWVPMDWGKAEVKIHSDSPFEKPEFQKFATEEEGREKSEHAWFWVIDSNVDVLPEFDFDFVPDTWDAGKVHVWQKLNPVTERQYDYDGVKLCPKELAGKGRPKYIKTPACKQKPFPIHYLAPARDIIDQLQEFDAHCDNRMYWVVDPFVRLTDEFHFDYYPSQWDEKNVHVFLADNEQGDHKNVRLYPKGTFTASTELTIEKVQNNSFGNLKLMNTVASLPPRWPDVTLVDMTRDELVHHISEYRKRDVPFLWTIDADVDADHTVFEKGFLPNTQNLHKVHLWQRSNPHTGMVHSYGGLRLWPTDMDTDTITTDTVLMNKIKGLQYVRETGSAYKPYDVVLITYHDADAEEQYERLKQRAPHAKWVKDVDGIFEAHKAAAEVAESKMFWVVDADADLVADFEFSYVPDQYDQETVHVWESENPITGDVYGYGGVKLFNRQQILDANSWGLDFTTGLSKRLKVMPDVSCVTAFNTDEYATWRSAFRETVKLASSRDRDSKERLARWLSPANMDADFVLAAKTGAEMGAAYGEQYAQKPMRLAKINDYEWLRKHYEDNVK